MNTPCVPMTNALTVDVEDYFQVSAFAPHIARAEWATRECRVERNVDCILGLLAQHDIKATFFTLGWIAERYPALVRQIVAQGHELASHGYAHERATDQTSAAFFADIQLAKVVLEDLAGQPVNGYRAPSFSMGPGNPWAFDELVRAGYRYSSSVYPIRHDHYGTPDAPRFAYEVRAGLLEIPITTLRAFKRNWPSGCRCSSAYGRQWSRPSWNSRPPRWKPQAPPRHRCWLWWARCAAATPRTSKGRAPGATGACCSVRISGVTRRAKD